MITALVVVSSVGGALLLIYLLVKWDGRTAENPRHPTPRANPTDTQTAADINDVLLYSTLATSSPPDGSHQVHPLPHHHDGATLPSDLHSGPTVHGSEAAGFDAGTCHSGGDFGGGHH